MKRLAVLALMTAALFLNSYAAQKFVVENGEKDSVQATCGGWWYTYNDAESGGNSTVAPLPQNFTKSKDGSKYVASMKGTAGNKLGWDFVGMGVTLSEKSGCPGGAVPVDLSKYSTLSFRIKGSITGGRLIVAISYTEDKCEEGKYGSKTLTDWADYEVGISSKLTKDWSTIKLDLRKDFKQPLWAKKKVSIEDVLKNVLKNAHNISWHFTSQDWDSVEISLDNVEFN